MFKLNKETITGAILGIGGTVAANKLGLFGKKTSTKKPATKRKKASKARKK